MIEHGSVQIESLLHAGYVCRPGAQRLYILAHGYMLDGQKMMDWIQPHLPANSAILAPNGPYPIPIKEQQGYRVAYSWYFFDDFKRQYFIGYDICKAYVASLVKKLELQHQPITIIGYSQGGYAAIHMAESLPQVDHVIGVNCQFVVENLQFNPGLRVDAIHGADDKLVDPIKAQRLFSQLPSEVQGRFVSIKGQGHRIEAPILEQLEVLVREN